MWLGGSITWGGAHVVYEANSGYAVVCDVQFFLNLVWACRIKLISNVSLFCVMQVYPLDFLGCESFKMKGIVADVMM